MDNGSQNNRIDMKHGFMKTIIKNQVDRDNYDKDMKIQPKQKYHGDQTNRSKKPDRKTYSAPKHNTRTSHYTNGRPRQLLYILEYEDKHHKIHELEIYQGDSSLKKAETFGFRHGLSQSMILALADVIKKNIIQRLNS